MDDIVQTFFEAKFKLKDESKIFAKIVAKRKVALRKIGDEIVLREKISTVNTTPRCEFGVRDIILAR